MIFLPHERRRAGQVVLDYYLNDSGGYDVSRLSQLDPA